MFILPGLKITATDGTSEIISASALFHIHLAAPSGTQPYNAPRITQVIYTDHTGAYTVVNPAQYNGANTLYEVGIMTSDGIWMSQLSNR